MSLDIVTCTNRSGDNVGVIPRATTFIAVSEPTTRWPSGAPKPWLIDVPFKYSKESASFRNTRMPLLVSTTVSNGPQASPGSKLWNHSIDGCGLGDAGTYDRAIGAGRLAG